VLITAVLHDTIEDTNTDCDDLEEAFGPEVAAGVALLSKDRRRPFDEREREYCEQLARAPGPVQVCKLADIFDNLMDLANLPPERRRRSLDNARRYLDALRTDLKEPAAGPWQTVANLYEEVKGA
jgi:(p)ppGpp synthase/HD superfamily hydrolase